MASKDKPKIQKAFDKTTSPSAQPKFSLDPLASRRAATAAGRCAECHVPDRESALGPEAAVAPIQGPNVQAEFRIEDLLKRHVENRLLRSVASCSGCDGCGQRS